MGYERKDPGVADLAETLRDLQSRKPGGLRKLADPVPMCNHPEHNPPSHIVLEPGLWEYTCPACGHTITFQVPMISC